MLGVDWVSAISVDGGERFNQTRIPDREQRSPGHYSQINKAERGADRDQANEVPDADANACSVYSRYNDQIHFHHLHKDHPAGKDTKLVWIFLNRLQQQNPERYEEPADHQNHAECPPRLRISYQEKLGLLRDVCIPDEHVLTKTDVGPEDAEREHPFPHDVIVLNCD